MLTKIGSIIGKETVELDTNNVPVSDPSLLDNFTKLAVLTVLAAYRKENIIKVADEFSPNIDRKKLGRFMSYVVNHPIAPMVYDLKIQQSATAESINMPYEPNDHEVVLNFSGGIDSTAGLLYNLDSSQNVLPLVVSFGQKNQAEELASIERIRRKLAIAVKTVQVDLAQEVDKGAREWQYIVPGRNFLFMAIANSILRRSQSASASIHLCAVKEELGKQKHRDKSLYYFRNVGKYFSQDTGKKITTGSPFTQYTKAEILYWWRTHWEKRYGISPHDTATCYNGHKCGTCRACFRREVSLICAGYEVDPELQAHPLSDPVGFIKHTWIPEIQSGKKPRTSTLDFLIALERSRQIAPTHLRKYLDETSWQTRRAMTARQKKIESTQLT